MCTTTNKPSENYKRMVAMIDATRDRVNAVLNPRVFTSLAEEWMCDPSDEQVSFRFLWPADDCGANTLSIANKFAEAYETLYGVLAYVTVRNGVCYLTIFNDRDND